jgi:hypothetical protein
MGAKSWTDGSLVLHVGRTNRKTRERESLGVEEKPTFTPEAGYKAGTNVALNVGRWNAPLASASITVERYALGATPGVTTPLETSLSAGLDPTASKTYAIPAATQTQFLRGKVQVTDILGRTAIVYTTDLPTILPAATPINTGLPALAGTTDPSGNITVGSLGTWQDVAVPAGLSWCLQSDDVDIAGTTGFSSYAKTSANSGHTLRLRVWATGLEALTSVKSAGILITAPVAGKPAFVPRAYWGVTEKSSTTSIGPRDVEIGTFRAGSPGAMPMDAAYDYFTQVVARPVDPNVPPVPNFNTITPVSATGNDLQHKLSEYPIGTPIMTYLWARNKANPNVYYQVNDPADTVTVDGVTAPYPYAEIVGPDIVVGGTPPSYSSGPALTPAGPVTPGVTITMTDATPAGTQPITNAREWLRSGVVLTAQAGLTSYTPVQSDVGASITARNVATNSAGGPVTSPLSNAVAVQATTTGPTDLPAVPSAVLSAAMAKPLAQFDDTNTGTVNTGTSGGYQLIEAYNSYQGKTNSDAAVVAQLRYNLIGGNDPAWVGGYGIEHQFMHAASAALARRTPRIWSGAGGATALTVAEQNKVIIQQQNALACACAMTGPGNKKLSFIGFKDWATGGNPNFLMARPATILACRMFFGSAKACKDFLATYDRAAQKAATAAAGLTNAAASFRTSTYSDAEVEAIVDNWSWTGLGHTYNLDTLDDLIVTVMNDMFNQNVMSGVGGTAANGWIGPGVPGTNAGKIVSGASSLPNKGKIGMAQEYNSNDAKGKRSSSTYVEDGMKLTDGILILAMCDGSLRPGDSDWSATLDRVDIGMADHFYKTTQGYTGYQKGGVEDLWSYTARTGFGLEYMHKIWPDMVKPWANAQ